ncbi:MAG: AMP-binding protein [Oscillospiraceae bacterium]|nr:AMP-binding protein [Oscillospiraceae bacterium]
MDIIKKTYAVSELPPADSYEVRYKDLIKRRIAAAPDTVLFRSKDHATGAEISVLPAEFLQQMEDFGAWIRAQGYNRDHIAILGDNSYQWILTMFSVIACDNVVIPLDKGLEFSTLDTLVGRSDAKARFYSKAFAQKAEKLAEDHGLKLYPLENVADYVSEGAKLAHEDIDTDPDALAILMYTSGTTGISKGVMLSQRNTISNISFASMQTDLSGDSVYLLPLNHIYGLGSALLITVVTNGTVTINTNLRYMMKDLQEARPEALFIVPLFLENLYLGLWKGIKAHGLEEKITAMIEENRSKGNVTPEEKRAMFSDVLAFMGGRLRKIISGGAPLNIKYYEGMKDFGIEVLNGYGITECAPVLAVNRNELNKPESVGKSIIGCEIKIEDPDNEGNGEICAKGPNVMLGYYKDDEENRKALIDGWFHTGDKGFLDQDDYIHVCGRIKNLIILSNGENVSPEEIENLLYNEPSIAEVVVYDKDGCITAQIFKNEEYITQNGIEDAEKKIKDHITALNRGLAVYKRINRVEFRDEPFERTSSKKIKRNSVI